MEIAQHDDCTLPRGLGGAAQSRRPWENEQRDGGNGELVIEVRDTGAGIPAANLPRIYDPFFTTRLGSGGSGLGLYITHNIVTGVLGGRIDVTSTEGEGARFTLRLPKVAPL